MAAFAAVYLSVRLPWIKCDPGVPSVWEYGYNATDEGYYLSGGKEKLLWGRFVDLPRNEAFTYGFSAGTHWLSHLAHRVAGLSTWAWRVPFVFVYLLAWLAMFIHLAKREGPALSFLLCASVSLVPMVIAYERTASNDALISALLVLSYVLGAGKARWRIVLSPVLAGAIILVKPSVWVLLPIAAAGVAQDRPWRECVRDVLLFLLVAVVSAFVWKGIVLLSVLPDAAHAGVSVREIIKQTTTHYPLPPIFDFASHFRGLSSFPRDPSIQLLGVAAPLIAAFPFAMFLRNLAVGRMNGRLLLFIAIPAYVGAVSVMNTIYTHYFLPVVVMIPLLVSAIAAEMSSACEKHDSPPWRKILAFLAVAAAFCAVTLVAVALCKTKPETASEFYSKVYNHPARNVWLLVWPGMALFAVGSAAIPALARGGKMPRLELAACIVAAIVTASVVFAIYPAVQIGPYLKAPSGTYFAPMAVALICSVLFLFAVFGIGNSVRWRQAAPFALAITLFVCAVATPGWRTSFVELARPGTKRHARVAKELATLLPPEAIVLGERSNQMLMSLPVRTATTFATGSNPIPVIESILAAEPEAKLYALADSQHAYNLRNYREHQDKYRLHHVRTFKMPSFGSGAPADVYLCRIEVLERPNAGGTGK